MPEQLLLQIKPPGRTYDEFPKPSEHKGIPSVDKQMPSYAWSQEDWALHMNQQHPYINYSDGTSTEGKEFCERYG